MTVPTKMRLALGAIRENAGHRFAEPLHSARVRLLVTAAETVNVKVHRTIAIASRATSLHELMSAPTRRTDHELGFGFQRFDGAVPRAAVSPCLVA